MRGCRRIVLGFLVLLVVGALLGDRGAKGYAESTIETSLRREVSGVRDVDASISSFPFVGRLLVSGHVSHLELVFDDVVGRAVPVEELRIEVEDLEVDRQRLLRGDRVEITGSGEVRVQATISKEGVRELLGPLTDAAFALTAGTQLRVVDGRIQLAEGVAIPVPSAELVPCNATATIRQDEVRVECVAETLPQVLIDAVGSAALRAG